MEELSEYVRSLASDELTRRIEAHINECSECAQAVSRMVLEIVKDEKLTLQRQQP